MKGIWFFEAASRNQLPAEPTLRHTLFFLSFFFYDLQTLLRMSATEERAKAELNRATATADGAKTEATERAQGTNPTVATVSVAASA
jgi:hypothetical protein